MYLGLDAIACKVMRFILENDVIKDILYLMMCFLRFYHSCYDIVISINVSFILKLLYSKKNAKFCYGELSLIFIIGPRIKSFNHFVIVISIITVIKDLLVKPTLFQCKIKTDENIFKELLRILKLN